MEALIAAAIVVSYGAGRWRERRRWRAQRDEAYRLLDEALQARKESRQAFDVQMDVIRQQRELLHTFSVNVQRMHQRRDDTEGFDIWNELRAAATRARTELL